MTSYKIHTLGSDPFYTVTHVFEVWHDNKIEMISKSKALLVSYTLLSKSVHVTSVYVLVTNVLQSLIGIEPFV